MTNTQTTSVAAQATAPIEGASVTFAGRRAKRLGLLGKLQRPGLKSLPAVLALAVSGLTVLGAATAQAQIYRQGIANSASQCRSFCQQWRGQCRGWTFNRSTRLCRLLVGRPVVNRPPQQRHVWTAASCRQRYGRNVTAMNGRCVPLGIIRYGNEPDRACKRIYGPTAYYSWHTRRCHRSRGTGVAGPGRVVHRPRNWAECRAKFGSRAVWRNGVCSMRTRTIVGAGGQVRSGAPAAGRRPVSRAPAGGRRPVSGSRGRTCIYGIC